MASYIGDGWDDLEGYIAGSPPNAAGQRLYDPLTFTYRAITPMETAALSRRTSLMLEKELAENGDGSKTEMAIYDFIASKLKSWDLKAKGVHPLPINGKNVSGMQFTLFSILREIMYNQRLSDIKPDETKPAHSADDLLGNSSAASA